jgi:uncharacterized membrane protein YccC
VHLPFHWSWPHGGALHYCGKVFCATLLGYLLTIGDASYAIYSTFTAALVVGASRGEDIGGAANRVRGSLAGMLAGLALTQAAIPPALSVALGVAATAYLCMGFGWGMPAARIGATLCAVTVLLHGGDALSYAAMRLLNTLVGVAAGLLVSYLVLPVGGKDAVSRASQAALQAVGALLDALARSERTAHAAHLVAVLDSMTGLEKVLHDADREVGGQALALEQRVRQTELACLGALTAALAHSEVPAGAQAQAEPLRRQAREIAQRIASGTAPAAADAGEAASLRDDAALQGFALGLRKIETALHRLGR